MADEANQTDAGSPAVDPVKNLKAEMDRKLSNLEESLANLPGIIEQQMAALSNRMVPPTPAPQQEDSELDVITDPKGFVNKLINHVGQAVDQKLQNYEATAMNRTALYSEFPELQNMNDGLTKEVVTRYKKLSDAQKKADSDGYLKSIVYQVAAEQGVRPRSYRQSNGNDDFSLSGKSGESNLSTRKPNDNELDPITETWMEVLKKSGAPIDPNNKEDVEKVKAHSKRTNWSAFAGSKDFKRGRK